VALTQAARQCIIHENREKKRVEEKMGSGGSGIFSQSGAFSQMNGAAHFFYGHAGFLQSTSYPFSFLGGCPGRAVLISSSEFRNGARQFSDPKNHGNKRPGPRLVASRKRLS